MFLYVFINIFAYNKACSKKSRENIIDKSKDNVIIGKNLKVVAKAMTNTKSGYYASRVNFKDKQFLFLLNKLVELLGLEF